MTLTITYIQTQDKATSISMEVDSYAEALDYLSDVEPIDLDKVKELNISLNLEN